MLVQVITEVPDSVFDPALKEVEAIDWDSIIDSSRKNNEVFSTSTAIHLRIHKFDHNNPPKTIEEFSSIVECEDNLPKSSFYSANYRLAQWIMDQVNGISLGRIMIIRLESGGKVGLHVDPCEYFEVHSRYHIPLRTNDGVLFSGGDQVYEHMPYKSLCRLNNRLPHMLENNGLDYRIHLLVDIRTKNGNKIF